MREQGPFEALLKFYALDHVGFNFLIIFGNFLCNLNTLHHTYNPSLIQGLFLALDLVVVCVLAVTITSIGTARLQYGFYEVAHIGA